MNSTLNQPLPDARTPDALDALPEVVASLLRGLLESVKAQACAAPPTADPWITTSEGARYAAVSEDTLREWIRSGQLPAGRNGYRVLRVRRSDIDRLLLAGGHGPDGTSEPVSDRSREIVASLSTTKEGEDG